MAALGVLDRSMLVQPRLRWRLRSVVAPQAGHTTELPCEEFSKACKQRRQMTLRASAWRSWRVWKKRDIKAASNTSANEPPSAKHTNSVRVSSIGGLIVELDPNRQPAAVARQFWIENHPAQPGFQWCGDGTRGLGQ